MTDYRPPIQISSIILQQVADICELVGRLSVTAKETSSPRLRRYNRLRTIHASLAIENNTLTIDQMTAVLDGKRVVGIPREIQEVRNAFSAYEHMHLWKPQSEADLLKAHDLLMNGLVENSGRFRSKGAGVFRENQLIHMAPPAKQVPRLIGELMGWLSSTDLHPLVASSTFHYEFEFIHPFADGNGRMGRLWQTLILSQWNPIFAYLPVETVVHERQEDYYHALATSDASADAGPFVEFMLEALNSAITNSLKSKAYGSPKGSSKGSSISSPKGSPKTDERLLELLKADPVMTSEKLSIVLRISKRAVLKHVSRLKIQGRLRRIGPARGGYWEVP